MKVLVGIRAVIRHHRAFIIIEQVKDSDRLSVAELYAQVYSAWPWNERWTLDSALAEFDEVSVKKGFVAVCARLDDVLVGFSWSYSIPGRNTSRVDFIKIRGELANQGISPETCCYGADTGVKEAFRGLGIGERLLGSRLCLDGSEYVCFRTKNLSMVDRYRALLGPELFSFPEESAYEGGRGYVFAQGLNNNGAEDGA